LLPKKSLRSRWEYQLPIAADRIDRIEQQFHSSPWNIRLISKLPIVLKSSGTENRPRRNPSLRTCFPVGVSRAVTLTIGFPAFGNDERLSARCLVYQTGQLRFGFMYVDCDHATSGALSSCSLVQYE
jgi:hypothetical protein